jgi:hypothetical protein
MWPADHECVFCQCCEYLRLLFMSESCYHDRPQQYPARQPLSPRSLRDRFRPTQPHHTTLSPVPSLRLPVTRVLKRGTLKLRPCSINSVRVPLFREPYLCLRSSNVVVLFEFKFSINDSSS